LSVSAVEETKVAAFEDVTNDEVKWLKSFGTE
jgi:hypothetical protein